MKINNKKEVEKLMVLKFAKENLRELVDELESLHSENKMLEKQLAYIQKELNEYHAAEQEREEQEQKEHMFNIDKVVVETDTVSENTKITFIHMLDDEIFYDQAIMIINGEIDYCNAILVDFGFSSNEPPINEIFEVVSLYGC